MSITIFLQARAVRKVSLRVAPKQISAGPMNRRPAGEEGHFGRLTVLRATSAGFAVLWFAALRSRLRRIRKRLMSPRPDGKTLAALSSVIKPFAIAARILLCSLRASSRSLSSFVRSRRAAADSGALSAILNAV